MDSSASSKIFSTATLNDAEGVVKAPGRQKDCGRYLARPFEDGGVSEWFQRVGSQSISVEDLALKLFQAQNKSKWSVKD